MGNTAKHSKHDRHKDPKHRDLISEEEFNRRVIKRNSADPEEDSRGDSAIDTHLEIDLGKRGTEVSLSTLKEIEEEDEGHIKAESKTSGAQRSISR